MLLRLFAALVQSFLLKLHYDFAVAEKFGEKNIIFLNNLENDG